MRDHDVLDHQVIVDKQVPDARKIGGDRQKGHDPVDLVRGKFFLFFRLVSVGSVTEKASQDKQKKKGQ